MPDRSRILVVDDETQITRVLKTTLSSQGYEVKTATNGEEGFNATMDWLPDLIITDLSMPRMNGVELCRAVRERSQVPIIVLSVRGDEKNKIEALDAGADDYVTKPFSANELLARIRANLRRVAAGKESVSEPIEQGDFFIDPEARIVRVDGKEIHLTPKEFDLLVYMARHPNKVLTHRVLLNAVWGGDSVQQPEYLRVFINQLRKKIEPGETPRYILTDPWVGYRFQPGEE
ncbi:MAG: DNA-binding response regulator [Candidatus Angelobacter sp. Gp1-AA117]|nr:MAG: DNA-binding response regulator [Candidatus Angelobacter sp. Gp1-AA117]